MAALFLHLTFPEGAFTVPLGPDTSTITYADHIDAKPDAIPPDRSSLYQFTAQGLTVNSRKILTLRVLGETDLAELDIPANTQGYWRTAKDYVPPAPDHTAARRVVNEAGDTLTWTAVYMEHGRRHESPCASLDDAVGLLLGGAENGLWACKEILGPDGAVLYRFDETMGIHDLAEQLRGEAGEGIAP